jgi:hypothetical protein
MLSGILTAFIFGFFYLVGAIPAGMAAHAPLWVAAISAWLGYSSGGMVVLVAGAPLRGWLTTKLKIDPRPDPSKLFWRIWARFGLWGLCLVAPVSVGPQATAVLALALGERAIKIQLSIALGVLPWVILFGVITHFGTHFWRH